MTKKDVKSPVSALPDTSANFRDIINVLSVISGQELRWKSGRDAWLMLAPRLIDYMWSLFDKAPSTYAL